MPDITALINSLNVATTMVKGLWALDRALDKAELKGKLVDVMDSLAAARVTAISLQEQIRDLQDKLELRAAMEFRSPAYWQTRDAKPDDGPFCPQCWDSQEKRIRLHPLHNGGLVCKNC